MREKIKKNVKTLIASMLQTLPELWSIGVRQETENRQYT